MIMEAPQEMAGAGNGLATTAGSEAPQASPMSSPPTNSAAGEPPTRNPTCSSPQTHPLEADEHDYHGATKGQAPHLEMGPDAARPISECQPQTREHMSANLHQRQSRKP